MSDVTDEQKEALEKFKQVLKDIGVSFLRHSNGDVIFAFRRDKLQEFLDRLDASGKDEILVLIQGIDGASMVN